ncbi:hydrogenase maturation protease [Myxococcota bacterium]|nr:hydrogenase maturation protease [Myxococcota bacterium]
MSPGAERDRWLVVGLGNPLRGDDGLGARVVELLSGVEGLDTRAEHGPTPELAEEIAHYARVVFVDAAVCDAGASEGASELVPVVALGASAARSVLGHALDVPTVVRLARELFDFRGEAYVCGLRAERFDRPFALTPAAEARAHDAAARLRELVAPIEPG